MTDLSAEEPTDVLQYNGSARRPVSESSSETPSRQNPGCAKKLFVFDDGGHVIREESYPPGRLNGSSAPEQDGGAPGLHSTGC